MAQSQSTDQWTLTDFCAASPFIALAIANKVALYWYAYGLWPSSWPALLLFDLVTGPLVRVMAQSVLGKRKLQL